MQNLFSYALQFAVCECLSFSQGESESVYVCVYFERWTERGGENVKHYELYNMMTQTDSDEQRTVEQIDQITQAVVPNI
jgi:hypothetical protein